MPTIVLDRDGVINQDSDAYIKTPDEWYAIKGSLDAIKRLNDAGYDVCIATNQSGLGRDLFSIEILADIHQKMINELEAMGGRIHLIAFCPHHPDIGCDCRKPKPGLLQAINEQFPLDADTTDGWRHRKRHRMRGEWEFAVRFTGKGLRELDDGVVSRETTPVFSDLSEFVNWLL